MWYNNYVGIPYKDNGRDEAGLDCWGLVRLVYKNQFDIDLPSFSTNYLGASDLETTTELIARNRESWQQVQDRVIGSVILFKIFGRQAHVGVYIGNNKFLHAREGHASAIESLNSTMWKDRVIGFFSYTPNTSVIVNAVPSPLKTQRYVEVLKEGCTLKQVMQQITDKYKISQKLKSKVLVLLNGKLAEERDFDRQLTRFDTIEYRVVPEGSNPLRSILMIAVMIIAWEVAPYLAAELGGTAATGSVAVVDGAAGALGAGGGSTFLTSAIRMGLTMVGMALVDAIAPIRPQTAREQGSPGTAGSLNLFSGGSNRAVQYGPLPIVLGKMRMTPPLATSLLLQPQEYTSYLNMNLCWGIGDIFLDETTLMVGGVTLEEYATKGDHRPTIYVLDNWGTTTSVDDTAEFKRIFSTDIKQVYPNQEIAANGEVGIPGPWKEIILEDESVDPAQKINKFTATFTFPEGLRKVWTGGSNAGVSEAAEIQLEIQYARRNPDTGIYESFSSTGTSDRTTRLFKTKEVACAFPEVVGIAGNPNVNPGFWTRIGIKNNGLVIVRGALADQYTAGNQQNATLSTEFKDYLISRGYGYSSEGVGTYTVFPDFNDSGVIPLASLWVTATGAGSQVLIDHTSAAGIQKSGLVISAVDQMGPNVEDGFGNSAPGPQIGYYLQITAGTITDATNTNYVSLNQIRKDAFNYTTPEIQLDPPGDYKVRVRRINDDTGDYDGKTQPVAALTHNSTIVIPTTGYIGTDIGRTEIYIGAGYREGYLTYTSDLSVGKGQWRIMSIVAPAGVTMGTYAAIPSANKGLRIEAPVSVSPSFTAGDITYNIEAINEGGTRYEYSLVQRIQKSTTPIKYKTETVRPLLFDNARDGILHIALADQTHQATPNYTRPIQEGDNLYFTVHEQNSPEPATATRLYNDQIGYILNLNHPTEPDGLGVWHNQVGYPTIATNFIDNTLYVYRFRIYTDANKTQLVAEQKVYYRHIEDVPDPFRIFSKAILYTVTGYTNQDNFIAPKYKLGNTLTDCKILRTGIRLQSSSKVNGQVDGINGIVQSVAPVWYPTSPSNLLVGTWKTEPTNNPASLFLYVLRHPANAYRVNAATIQELEQYVDLNAVKEWHYYCAQESFTFNTVLENVTSVMDILRDICAAGRASPLMKDGKWSVVVDKPKTEIVQHFSPHNSWGFEATRIIPRVPDAFRCVIREEELGYQDREIIVYNQGKTNTNAEIYEQISLPGITNQATAEKHIQWNLAQVNLRPERYTINTDLEYLVCNRGDRVKVVHDVPLWGTASGRIGTVTITGSQRQFDLDDVVLLEANTNYVIRVRLSDGRFELGSLQVNETKYYSSLTYTVTQARPSGSPLPSNGDLFLIGTTDTAINDLMVISIETLDNKSARLVLTDYAPSIFTTDHSQVYSNITATINTKPPSDLISSITVAPLSVQFLSGEANATVVSPTVLSYNITATVQNYPELPDSVTGIEVQYVPNTSNFDANLNVTTKRFSLSETVILNNVEIGTTYKIRLRYIGQDRVGPWMLNGQLTYFTHTVAANSIFSDVLSAVEVDLDRYSLYINIIRASSTPPPTFSHYEIRVLKDPNSLVTGDFWDAGDDPQNALYNDIIKATSITGQFNISLLNFAKPRLDPDGVMYRIACRSVDTSGNISSISFIQSYLLFPLT